MISLIPKILLYKLQYSINFPRIMPMNYTVSLTYKCNSRCSTCNIYKKKANNFTVAEYEKTFKSIGKSPFWVTLSGGEPFLRNDIVDIAKTIYKYSKPRILNIPTNGILTDRIVEYVDAIATYCKKTQIIINVSIDGIEEQHDRIRNVPRNYEKVIDTFHRLKDLKHKNLAIGIHTVISKINVDDFAEIANHLMALNPDSYITEIAEERIELGTMGTGITPRLVAYKSAIDFLIHRIKNTKFRGMNKITQSFRIEYCNLVKKILRDKTQVIPCYAGRSSVQISPDGDVWACCIKAESMGNLRETNYRIKPIIFGKKARSIKKSIKNKECHCPMANASYTNMLMDFRILLRVFYRTFIKWWV